MLFGHITALYSLTLLVSEMLVIKRMERLKTKGADETEGRMTKVSNKIY